MNIKSWLVFGFCLIALNAAVSCEIEEEYIAPRNSYAFNPFEALNVKSDQDTETFSSVALFLHAIKDSCHQFTFKYPLQSAEHAKAFAEVLQIKVLEPYRFVPVIVDCQFLESRNLGFSRRVDIIDGSSAQEHVLVNATYDSVIFIEEFSVMPNGEIKPGAFATENSVVEENGAWYFSGVYLYADQPTEEQIQGRMAMFKLTYENMVDFIINSP